MWAAGQMLRHGQRLRLGAGGAWLPFPARQTPRTLRRAPAAQQDFSDLVSKVQEKARELRDSAALRPLQWAKSGFGGAAQQQPQPPVDADAPQPQRDDEDVAEAVRTDSIGFGFSAGGMLFPYYIGILEGLQGMGIANERTPFAGASAGSILAVCHHSGLSIEEITAACLELAHDCRVNGTRGRLGEVLEQFLVRLLPDDIHERCKGKAYVAVTKAFPRPTGLLVSNFESRDDLIRTILTSCHIPWWFDSNLTTLYRGAMHYDGGLTNFLPLPPAIRAGVRCCCFPSKQVSSVYAIHISPDSYATCPYSMRELLAWAFQPADDDTLVQLVSKGRADAEAWALVSGAYEAQQQKQQQGPPAKQTALG